MVGLNDAMMGRTTDKRVVAAISDRDSDLGGRVAHSFKNDAYG